MSDLLRLLPYLLCGVACLVLFTLPFDLAGVESFWVVIGGVLAGIAGMLGSAWVFGRKIQ